MKFCKQDLSEKSRMDGSHTSSAETYVTIKMAENGEMLALSHPE